MTIFWNVISPRYTIWHAVIGQKLDRLWLIAKCSWWRPLLETFSALLALCDSLHKGQWRRTWMFSMICAWINGCVTWWRHQMETFSALLALCAGNSPVPGEFPTHRPVTRSFDVYFDLRPNKRLGKQSWGWWFQTLSWSLWRHRNDNRGVGEFRPNRAHYDSLEKQCNRTNTPTALILLPH